MENQNKNVRLYALIAILCVLVLGLGGYIVYDKVVSNGPKTSSKPIKTDNNIDNNKKNDDKTNNNDTKIDDCSITSIKGLDITLKNTKRNNGYITSDVYINNTYSTNISYHDASYNDCENILIEEIDNDYFLMSFASEAATYTDFYLFNKSGKFITNFEEWRKKYDNSYLDIYVSSNDKGGLLISYFSGMGWDMGLTDLYCEFKATPKDIYTSTEYVSIVNDELKTTKTEKTTWEEAYLCKDGNKEDCGNINNISCAN